MNFYIKNLGCKYNSFESNKIKELLLKNGFIASSSDDANFIIINTCSVTQVADKKTRQMIRSYKNNNKNAIIVAIGCSVDLNYDELKDFTDILIKNDEKDNIFNILNEYINAHNIKENNQVENHQEDNDLEIKSEIKNNVRAFVGIQNGCNQFCTYCIIPYLRGRIRSEREENILNEVKELTKKGIKEIVYTGIHLSSYSLSGNESYENENDRIKARKNLISLLNKTAEIDYVKRIRLGSLECRIIDDEFLDAISSGNLKYKFCPSFCLSLQSGADKVLKNMNRHYTASEYEDIVNNIKNKLLKKNDLYNKEIEDSKDLDKYKIYGELINTYGYDKNNIKNDKLVCINHYDNKEIIIPLDMSKSIPENANNCFNKYNKLKRTIETANELLIKNDLELAHIEEILNSYEFINDERDLFLIKKELNEYFKYIDKKLDSAKSKSNKNKINYNIDHYKSSTGIDIYVGKNNLQNEYLTFTLANPTDTWLHVKNRTGSHVIIKKPYEELDMKTIEEAASLAAYYSTMKNETKVTVDYTLKKELKKVKGKPPGFVIYNKNFSINVEPGVFLRKI